MRKCSLYLILLLIFTFSIPAVAQDANVFESDWRAEYFNNPYLAGRPNLTRFDQRIGFDWGTDAPASGLPRDNFSIRWGKGGNMPSGTYRFIVTASLGFRLYIDNEVILDTWDGGADGVTIGRDIYIEGGNHNIQLDYRALGGRSYIYLDWGLAPNGEVAPQSTATPTANSVTIIANTLNVRSEPRIANNITTRVSRGQQFTQIAVSADGRWIQLDLGNGTTGWVSATYTSSSIGAVSSTDLTGQSLRSTTRLLIRSAPNTDAEALGLLLRNETANIIGRSADGEWWQIQDNNLIGWVNICCVVLSPDVNVDSIAITN